MSAWDSGKGSYQARFGTYQDGTSKTLGLTEAYGRCRDQGTLWALDAAPERFALGAVLADCGYLSSMEQPQAVTALLLYWLQDG